MLPRTTPEQRERFYDDVENLLTPGFLTHPVSVGGVRLHMRSLGAGDLFMLKARTEGANEHEWRVWAVATSIWMVDGRTVLGHDEAIPFVADYLRKLPRNIIEILFSILLGLWIRVSEAIEIIEVFCFETGSRYKWKTIGQAGIQNSGVPGSDRIGLNTAQRIWVAFNEMEDLKRSEEVSWEGFKLVASSNAPKAITKIDKKDQQRRKDEADDRQRRLDLSYYVKLGVVDKKGKVEGTDGSLHRVSGTKSAEDLEEEMRRWVTDDQDHHDRTVSEYKAHIRVQQEQKRLERDAHRTALDQKREEMGWDSGEFQPRPLVAMTAQQLQAHLAERQVGPAGVAFIPKADNTDRVYRQHIGLPQDAGKLQVIGGKVVDIESNPTTDQRTLNQLIQGRNPAFGTGE